MKKGMTLIEILVTALILSMAIASMMFSFVKCQQILIRNSHKLNAIHLVESYFERMQHCTSEAELKSFLDSSTSYNATGTPSTGVYEKRSSSFRNKTYTYYLQIVPTSVVNTSGGEDLTMYTALVTWDNNPSNPAPENVLAMSMISNEPF